MSNAETRGETVGRGRGALLKEICALLKGDGPFLLLSHRNPDGDCLGSMLALGAFLTDRGAAVTMVNPDPVPELYAFLPGSERVVTPAALPTSASFSVAVAIDASDSKRLGEGATELLARTERVVTIDHHLTGVPFGDIRFLDPAAAATGELIYQLICACGGEEAITPAIATALYTALLTDTGSFRFANTTAATLRLAGILVAAGAKPAVIAEAVYDTRSAASLRLLARVLNHLQVSEDGRIAWLEVRRADLAATGAGVDETEGFVNYARMIKGVEVGLLFREDEDGKVKVSLRSRRELDVGRLAARFGGGGHARAAGCEVAASLLEAERLVLAATQAALTEREVGVSTRFPIAEDGEGP